ncbi:hypothetical protein ACWDWU_10670 [Streptomyces sp. NPDC003442]
MRVPYIAPWTGENAPPASIMTRHGRDGMEIGYADEYGIADRRRGALWIRVPVKPGVGAPLLDRVHALRQRQAMNFMLCQCCGRPTDDRRDGRRLFLLDAGTGPITDGERTTTPPICDGCALEAWGRPSARRGRVALLVEEATAWGVAGVGYAPATLRPVPGEHGERFTFVAYGDPRLRWTLACREVVALHGCTAVDLEDLRERTAI